MTLLPRYAANTARNVALAALGKLDKTASYPIEACFLVTWRCNLRCGYCYQNATVRGPIAGELDTAGVRRTLAGLREAVDLVAISGGEPTQREDLVEILGQARELRFAEVILNTNLVRLPDLSFLDHVTMVVAGINALTEEGFVSLTRGTSAQFEEQMENLELLARLREERRFDLALSSVICPEHLDEVERILAWCVEHDTLVSFSPFMRDLAVAPALVASARYREVADRLLRARRAGLPLIGSPGYYRSIRDLSPFRCIPLANMTVEPDGRMRWPCGEAPAAGPSFAEGKGFSEMVRELRASSVGVPPGCAGTCLSGCRLDLSTLVNRPWEIPGDALHRYRHKRYSR